MQSHRQSEFDVSRIRPRPGGLPHLETFTWQNLTPAERVTRSGRPGSRLGGSPHLSCKRDQIKMRDYMDRRVTPPKRVTSPTWSPPPPCKQALSSVRSVDVINSFCDSIYTLPKRQSQRTTVLFRDTLTVRRLFTTNWLNDSWVQSSHINKVFVTSELISHRCWIKSLILLGFSRMTSEGGHDQLNRR